MTRIALSTALWLTMTAAGFAGERTIHLSIPSMHCAACPYMIREAISGVEGVISASATMEGRSATVSFDDERTTVDDIKEATASIGYESILVESE